LETYAISAKVFTEAVTKNLKIIPGRVGASVREGTQNSLQSQDMSLKQFLPECHRGSAQTYVLSQYRRKQRERGDRRKIMPWRQMTIK